MDKTRTSSSEVEEEAQEMDKFLSDNGGMRT